MKKQSFIIGAFFLAIGGIFAKVIGAFYKIPLTSILGANGMGVYYLIFPLYSMALVFTSSGMSIAVTKLISTEYKCHNKINQSKILIVSSVISFSLSILFAFFIIFFSKEISLIQGNINAYVGYIMIAPAIICSSIIAILKGYFQGIGNMLPTSISMVFEQMVKLIIGLILAYKFLYLGIEFAVLGAVLGVTISEVVACVIIVINYLIHLNRRNKLFSNYTENRKLNNHSVFNYNMLPIKKNDKKIIVKKYSLNTEYKELVFHVYYSKNLNYKEVINKVLKYAFPATLSSIVMPLTNFIDSFLIINLLISVGFSSIVATSLYGLSTGVVSSLISLPILLISAITTTIIPNISNETGKMNSNNSRFVINEKCTFFIKITWLIALPMFIAFILYAPEIIEILFSGGLNNRGISEFEYAYKLLMLSSVSIVYYAFLQTFISILQAINKPEIPCLILFAFLFIRIWLVFILTSNKNINVFGSVMANIIYLAISSGVCLIFLKKYVNIEFKLKNNFLTPLLASGVAILLGYSIKFLLADCSVLLRTIISGIFFISCYLLLVLLFKVFTTDEKKFFPDIKLFKNKIMFK